LTQSGYIAATLIACFVLFLAARGRLSTYTSVLWGNTSQNVSQAPTKSSNGDGGIMGGNNGWTPSLDSNSMKEYGGYVETVLAFL